MLKPIPRALLTDSMTLKVCTGVDNWDNPTWALYPVQNVHIENTNEVRKTKDNTEVVLRSIIFVDPVRSTPALDYEALVQQSLTAGKPMRAVVQNFQGQTLGDYEILTVDPLPDYPATRTHHTELGCV